MPYISMLYFANTETLVSRRDDLFRGFFLDIARPSSCLHCFLPAPREQSVISRFHSSAKFPRVYTCTKRYCSFINYALDNASVLFRRLESVIKERYRKFRKSSAALHKAPFRSTASYLLSAVEKAPVRKFGTSPTSIGLDVCLQTSIWIDWSQPKWIFLNYVLTIDIMDININYSYQVADPADIIFSLTVQEDYGITCQLTILTFLI